MGVGGATRAIGYVFGGKTVLGVTYLSLGLSGRKLPASYSAENQTKKQFKTEIDESRRSKLSGYEMNGEEVGSGEGIQESVGGRVVLLRKAITQVGTFEVRG